jgi:hypothetical protein
MANLSATIHQGPPIDPLSIRDSRQTDPADPYKATVDALWYRLPEAVKSAVAAMVEATAKR